MSVPKHLQPRKSPKQDRSRQLVDAIVEATARVLVKDGFEALQVTDVAELAGVSVGSLYQYYPHKEALVVAVLEREAEREAAFLAERLAALTPPTLAGLLSAVIEGTMAFRADHRPLFNVLLAVIPVVGRYYDLRARGAAVAALMRSLMPLDVDDGSADTVVFVVANAVHAVTHEGLVPRPDALSDDAVAAEATRLALAYLRERGLC